MKRITNRVFPIAILGALTACASQSHLADLPQDMPVTESSKQKVGTQGRSIPNTVTQPTQFETPVINSEIRPFFLHHEFPQSYLLGGGDLQLYAVQARYAVNDKLAIIATKDGFIDFNPDLAGGALEDEGFADIAAGVKYAFVDEPDDPLLVTGGVIFETDSGDHEVLQGNGNGVLRPFVSAGYEWEQLNTVGSLGANLPFHTGRESTYIDYHLHFDWEVTPEFTPLVEFHGQTYTKSGNGVINTALGPVPVSGFEAGDLVNLGSSRVSGQSVFSGAVGARYRLNDDVSIGGAYSFPMGGRDEILDQRVTVDVIFTF